MAYLTRQLGTVLLLVCVAIPAHAEQLLIAVAANFTGVMRELVPIFEASSGHQVNVSYGSTGKLYSQIENGAPFEVFLAADSKRPQKAEQEGLAVSGSRFTYAVGRLALWSKKSDVFESGESYLKDGGFSRIALANPKTAPYGLAAQEVMEQLGVSGSLQAKLVRGDSIAQTFQFAATGNVAAGFVSLAQVKAWKGEAGTLWVIPEHYYQPIVQQAILLNRGADNLAAVVFMSFLKSREVQSIIANLGYNVASPER